MLPTLKTKDLAGQGNWRSVPIRSLPALPASLFLECAKQVTVAMPREMSDQDLRALHLQRFNNICALAKVVVSGAVGLARFL